MDKRIGQFIYKAFALLLCCAFLCCPVFASASCNLRVNIFDEDKNPIPMIDIELCQVTAFDGSEHALMPDFAELGITAEELDQEASAEQAEKIYQYIRANGIYAMLKTTNASGHADFLNLDEGFYLVLDRGGQAVAFQPYLVELPTETPTGPLRNVVSEPKAISPDSKTVSVYVEWMDDDNAAGKRPENVEVTLLRTSLRQRAASALAFRSVVVNEDCLWQHTFHGLPHGDEYTVRGYNLPNYRLVEIEPVMEGYVLIYEYDPNAGSSGDPSGEDPLPVPVPPVEEGKLPQTGFDLLPIYMMMAGGALLVVFGMADLCTAKEEE